MEFEDSVPFCTIFIRFWREGHLISVRICRFGSGNRFPVGHLGSIARLLSAFSTQNNIVSCSGCPSSILKALDKSPLSSKSVQYPFRFEDHNLQTLVRRSDCTVFGNIDFYSVLQYLVVFLGRAQHQTWLSEAPHLMEVRKFVLFFSCVEVVQFSTAIYLGRFHKSPGFEVLTRNLPRSDQILERDP